MSHIELSILEYLGGAKLLGIAAPRTPFAFHDLVSAGLPARSATFFKTSSGFTNIELSRLLGISEKTFIRWQETPKKPIDPVVSDRLYRTAKILALAAEVLEDRQAARAWLNDAQFGLGNKTPGELLTTDAGARQVEDLLLRMEHGYLA
jgi:putative toxin-antitoxin system antitoxin component (TIGR02293 family)